MPHPLEDASSRDSLLASTSATSVAVFLGMLGALTACVQLLSDHAGWLPAPGPVLLYVWLAVVVVAMYRPAIVEQNRRRFDLALLQLQPLQVLWVAAVSWEFPMGWAIASTCVMGIFLVAWAFLDAQQFQQSKRVRNLYLAGFVLVPPYLLALDAFGLEGLLTRMQHTPGYVLQWTFVLLLLAAVCMAILTVVGAQNRDAAKRRATAERILQDRTALATERQSLELVTRVLHGHVAAGRLRHDIASPIAVITATVDHLLESVDDPDLRDALDDVKAASGQLTTLLAALSTPATGPTAATMDVEDLLRAVDTSFRATLAGHGVVDAAVNAQLEPSTVWAGPDHALSIASLLVNGRMQQDREEIEVTGAVASDWYYRLSVRDFGVPARERERALTRVQSGLGLQTPAARDDGYRGLGLGLPLCKLQLASHGAWVAARAPSDGPGLVLEVVLPRVDPEEIPEAERTPELWVTAHPEEPQAGERS